MSDTRRRDRPRLVFNRDDRVSRPVEPVQTAHNERFRLLVLPHLDATYSFACYLVCDPAAAEDIVQDAFLRAFRAFGSCRSDEKAWLFAIVRNCFLDWVRVNARALQSGSVVAEAVPDSDPETILQGHHDAAAVRATIAALPEPFRETLVLRELEELSYREITAVTDVPIGTVMSRLARARQMLATLLLPRDTGGFGR